MSDDPDRDQALHTVKANLFKALAHPVRVRLLEELLEHSSHGASAAELAGVVGCTDEEIRLHLSVLRRHGAIVSVPSAEGPAFRIAHPRMAEMILSAREFLLETTLRAARSHAAATGAAVTLGDQASVTPITALRDTMAPREHAPVTQPLATQQLQSSAMAEYTEQLQAHSEPTSDDIG